MCRVRVYRLCILPNLRTVVGTGCMLPSFHVLRARVDVPFCYSCTPRAESAEPYIRASDDISNGVIFSVSVGDRCVHSLKLYPPAPRRRYSRWLVEIRSCFCTMQVSWVEGRNRRGFSSNAPPPPPPPPRAICFPSNTVGCFSCSFSAGEKLKGFEK